MSTLKRGLLTAVAGLAIAVFIYRKRDVFVMLLAVFVFSCAFTLLLAPLAQVGRWCAPTLGASTMMETAGPVMLLVSSVLLLYFRKKYHSILREGRV